MILVNKSKFSQYMDKEKYELIFKEYKKNGKIFFPVQRN